MIGDPANAPQRADLSFLRRRSRPRPAPAAATPAPSSGISYHRPDRATPTSTPTPTPAPPAPGSRPRIDFSRPDRHPAATPASPAPAAPAQPGGTRPRIDFSRPGRSSTAPAAPAPSAGGSSLDLSAPAASPGPAAPARPRPPALHVHGGTRVRAGEQVLLDVHSPTVTLTRVQSGVGALTVEAICSPEVGDLRLGAVYQLRSGGSSTVQLDGGNRFGPSARRPVIVASHEEYERLGLDLRQVGDVERVAIYAFSSSRSTLEWGGTLVISTFGGARVEIPLDTLYRSTVAVLVSLYNLDGELVIRAEMESITGDVREAARAYGYDRITWRDDRSPVD